METVQTKVKRPQRVSEVDSVLDLSKGILMHEGLSVSGAANEITRQMLLGNISEEEAVSKIKQRHCK